MVLGLPTWVDYTAATYLMVMAIMFYGPYTPEKFKARIKERYERAKLLFIIVGLGMVAVAFYLPIQAGLFDPLARVGNGGSGHSWTWISMAVEALVVMVVPFKQFSAPRGLILTGYTAAIHEGFWYATKAIVAYTANLGLALLGSTAQLIMFVMFGVSGVAWYKRSMKYMLLAFPIIIAVYVVWAYLGFHVTDDFTIPGGYTQWYRDATTNWTESDSWVITCASMTVMYVIGALRKQRDNKWSINAKL